MKVSLSVLVVSLCLPVSAVCSDTDWNIQPFMTLKAGYQWAQDDALQQTDPNGGVWGISGGLQFSPEWSWDLGYRSHNNKASRDNRDSVDVDSWFIDSAVRYDWYFKDDWSLYGRLGASYWRLEKSQPKIPTLSANGFSPFAETGVAYHFDQDFRLSAGCQYVDSIGNSETGKYDNHTLMLNLTYKFGQSSSFAPQETEITETNEPVIETTVFEMETTEKPAASEPVVGQETTEVTPIETAQPLDTEEVVAKVYTFSAITLGEAYSFDSGSVFIGEEFKQALKPIAETLVSFPQASVQIVGHTDATGSEVYNQILSERRASSVADQLVKQGVNPAQMQISGKGELAPTATNTSAEGRARNRRVEITITSFEYQQ